MSDLKPELLTIPAPQATIVGLRSTMEVRPYVLQDVLGISGMDVPCVSTLHFMPAGWEYRDHG